MKRFTVFSSLVVLVLVVAETGLATPITGQWYWQHPLPQGGTLYDVAYYDASHAVAVGDDGTVIDYSGNLWPWGGETERDGVQTRLFGVAYASASTAVAVGEDGVILKGWGYSYAKVASGTAERLEEISFGDATHGMVVGANGVILFTDDGGLHWLSLSSGTSADLLDVCMIDASTATVVGSAGTILRTTDGGATWVPQSSGISTSLVAVDCIDASTCVAVGPGAVILRTTDSGANWQIVPAPVPSMFDLCDVTFAGANKGFAVGRAEGSAPDYLNLSVILPTSDAGATWSSHITFSSEGSMPWAVSFMNDDNGFIVGDNGAVYGTTDGGASWSLSAGSASGARATGVDIADGAVFPSDSIIVAVAPSATSGTAQSTTILRSANQGYNWTSVGVPGYRLFDVTFADPTTAYAVGGGVTSLEMYAVVFKSVDAGATWTQVYEEFCFPGKPDCAPAELYAVDFGDATTGIAVGFGGGVLLPGLTPFQSGVLCDLYGVYMPTPSTAVAVGGGGAVLLSNDAGASWLLVESGTTNTLRDVWFASPTTGFAVGDSGTVLLTTDGGLTWGNRWEGETTEMFTAVAFDPQGWLGYVIAARGVAFGTADFGASWWEETTVAANLLDLTMVSDYQCVAVGSGQAVVRRSLPQTVAVLIKSFVASIGARGVRLEWSLSTDEFIAGFRVYRDGVSLDPDLIPANATSYSDDKVSPGRSYEYVLAAVREDGSEVRSPVTTIGVPGVETALEQNWPNPFNPTTTIAFSLPSPKRVRLDVFDVNGRRVVTLASGVMPAGRHEVEWKGMNAGGQPVGSGVYFYRLQTDERILTRRMVLLK